MNISQLKTPAFLIDLPKAKRNAENMLARASSFGVSLRPHVKTHKCIELARLQVGGRTGKIAVSTLAEARAFCSRGFDDITYAVPVVVAKLDEVVDLMTTGVRFNVLVDGYQTAADIQKYGYAKGIKFRVLLKVDCGYHRAGVDPLSPESIRLAKFLSRSPAIDFLGILTHAGHSYAASSPEQIAAVAAEEREVMTTFAAKLIEADINPGEVSVGSTPTCVRAANWDGVTEIRPGNYILFDKFQADIGSCSTDECAATVLARVIGNYPERSQLIIDAGALALSKDVGASHISDKISYGAIVGFPNLRIESLSQEHGIVRMHGPCQLNVGDLVQVIPNHSCLSAALFPSFHIVEDEQIVDEWRPVRGW